MIRHATDCKVGKLNVIKYIGKTTEVSGWHVSYVQLPPPQPLRILRILLLLVCMLTWRG